MVICLSSTLTMTIRVIFRAVKIEGALAPYDTATLKIYYLAKPTGCEMEQMSGLIPADAAKAPFPVVVFMPEVNVGSEAYHWLAVRLAEQGLVVVTYILVAEEMPGFINLTPGVDMESVKPENYGNGPTGTAVSPILSALNDLNSDGILAGLLALDKIILGGHSAGGTIALQNGHPDWFPAIKAVFSYGAHTKASTMLGYEPGTILPLVANMPTLLIGGTCDGVIEASGIRYDAEASPTAAIERTFAEAMPGGQNDSYLVLLDGANHFTIVNPIDETTGRPFLDHPAAQNEDELRDCLVDLISLFIKAHVLNKTSAKNSLLEEIEKKPFIYRSECK